MRRAPILLLMSAGLVGCNQYDLFRLSGYQQESYSNEADILFVVDNSDSMTDEASALAVNFTKFIEEIATKEEQTVREDLSDAVENYKSYVKDPGGYVDFQIGITTTEIAYGHGELKGPPAQRILTRDTPDLADKFLENLLCEATCFRQASNIPSDPSYQCGAPLGAEVTVEYLDCVCGEGAWMDVHCAELGREEGLEATFMTLCRSVPNPPEECFAETSVGYGDDTTETEIVFTEDDVLSAEGFVRPGGTFIPVIVSDEGDDSRRELSGDQFPDVYEDLFQKFDTRLSWVIIGPPLDQNFESPTGCTGYQDWAAFRYDYMVRVSGGLKLPIALPSGGDCPNTDFGQNLNQFGDLLQNLLTVFELQSVPNPESIIVFVDGKQVDRSAIETVDDFGLNVYSSGWSYESDVNAIRFHGDAVPPNDARVQVYYDPIDGMPRALPL